MNTIQRTVLALFFIGTPALIGCGGSSGETPEQEASPPEPADDGLDALARDMGIEEEPEEPADKPARDPAREPAQSPEAPAPTDDADAESGSDADGARPWRAEREPTSLLGRSYQKAKDTRDAMRGGTDADLADTLDEEEYAQASGLRWDMPPGWRMAIPEGERFAQMFIESPTGAASVAFTRETGTPRTLVRQLEGRMIGSMGGRAGAETDETTILGRRVTRVSIDGTYIDPGAKGGRNEKPFFSLRAAVFDLGEERILVTMWGPEDTVGRAVPAFDRMIAQTSER